MTTFAKRAMDRERRSFRGVKIQLGSVYKNVDTEHQIVRGIQHMPTGAESETTHVVNILLIMRLYQLGVACIKLFYRKSSDR